MATAPCAREHAQPSIMLLNSRKGATISSSLAQTYRTSALETSHDLLAQAFSDCVRCEPEALTTHVDA